MARPLRLRSRCDGGWECVRQTWWARDASCGRDLGLDEDGSSDSMTVVSSRDVRGSLQMSHTSDPDGSSAEDSVCPGDDSSCRDELSLVLLTDLDMTILR